MRYILFILAILILAVDHRTPYEEAVDSAVQIQTGEGSGSGVFVAPDMVLTAYHVVEDEYDIRIHPPVRENGTVVNSPDRYRHGIRAQVVAISPGKDLALLRVEGTGSPMRLGRSPSPGDAVFVIGNGDNVRFRHVLGSVRAVYHDEAMTAGDAISARMVDITCPVNMGDSGGPLILNGRLVGIVSYINTDQFGVSKAIDAGEIADFLREASR